MRWRIGLLQDSAAIERQVARDAAEEAAKKQKQSIPTVKTEAQTKADEKAAAKAASEPPPPKRSQPKIKPLSEAKAIETGANFLSETFLFGVAAGLIFFESWRSRRKESNRRDDVADRLADLEDSERAARRALVELEREVLHLRSHDSDRPKDPHRRILRPEVYEAEAEDEKREDEVSRGWLTRIASFLSRDSPDKEATEALKTGSPGPAEKILVQADKQIDEKHKQRVADEEAAIAATSKPKASTLVVSTKS
jgi:optic atrophy 3 protein